ncbi:hypothetical protein H6G89_34065 [Oscillatoria sp. FACHB-1407]|uniref:hypothetical protein n=1 Tax=Oscillatoria sp. FACHB-1407 TaxID=2692847 RepID=UPI001688BDAD|nr:hypothetical protein [Oscillatoria sp. FACHB-1407]MBD2466014.1 hypothetical protein [Oscillatoria sp. FACHB-1407]
MALAVEAQELAIVVATKNHTPSILSPDFLTCSGIIGADLELAQAPVSTPQVSQLVFRNGISMMAQVDRLIFVEQIAAKSLQDVSIAQIARRYIAALPQAQYQGIGINVQGLVPLGHQTPSVENYLTQTFLVSGSWQEFGHTPVQANLQLRYTLEHAHLTLSVAQAALQLAEGETTPILVFSGHFDHRLTAEQPLMPQVMQALTQWQSDLETYQDLVNTRFLNTRLPEDSTIPVFAAVGL